MKRQLVMLYAFACYLAGVAAMTYLAFFIAGTIVPKTVDSGEPVHTAAALAINLALISLFGIQHSVMARKRFKGWWKRIVPAPAERSTYVLASAAVTAAIIYFWQPMPQVLWQAYPGMTATLLLALALAGWLFVFYTTYLISHFDLMGLRQAWRYYRNEPYTHMNFRMPMVYRFVRHPMQLGILVGVWATPNLTLGHLVFATGMTVYILIGLHYEEQDLVTRFGDHYRQFQQTTPKLIPQFRPSQADTAPARAEE